MSICSTIPPNTMDKVKDRLELLTGFKVEQDFYLAYVPERIAPGNTLKEFVESPRIVGGVGPNSTKVCSALFRIVCKKVIETDAITAEIVKTAENTFRDVNIAFANQLALICEQKGSDILHVVELANTHPRVNIHMAGPGVGGPCLTKDPIFLIQGSLFETQSIVSAAREINNFMPQHIIQLFMNALGLTERKAQNTRVGVLGTAYKANVDDSRFSPSKPIIKELLGLKTSVIAYDPLCTEAYGAEKAETLSDAIQDADCLVILTDSLEFRNLSLIKAKELMKTRPIILDAKRIINPKEAKDLGFEYVGVGFGRTKIF